MNTINYQKKLDEVLREEGVVGKRLLLHSCCAPCSSYVLSYLRDYFRITVFYYNPNITDPAEYELRKAEQVRFINELNKDPVCFSDNSSGRTDNCVGGTDSVNKCFEIDIIDADYDPESFFECAKGLEDAPEGGARCRNCFELRLSKTADKAGKEGYDYFCTTLSISPLKNAGLLNDIGNEMAERYGVAFLPSDFKKKEGYKKSIELSKEYDLYRQDYCGCEFSKRKG